MNTSRLVPAALAVLAFMNIATKASALGWPVWPDSSNHRIGNSLGTYQCYVEETCNPYFHPGTDILVPAGTPVYAVKSGYVKVLGDYGGALQWRLVIGDSSGTQECNAWRYDHMDSSTIPHSVGDTIEEGQLLGNVVTWSGYDFHHLHFTEIRSQGDSAAWSDNSRWRYMSNALDYLDPIADSNQPVFENAFGSQIFAYASNEADSYFGTGSEISGDVDVVCRVYDLINHDYWKVAPYKLEYQVSGDSTTPWVNSICFADEVLTFELSDQTEVIYQDDSTCDTRCSYVTRQFYFNVTNTDGDSVLELSDKSQSWQTPYFHNGQYTVAVRAWDAYGNSAMESMVVTVENFFELSGTALLGARNTAGQTVVSIASSGQSDTADIDGLFSIPNVGGGSQLVEIRCDGYEPVDTVIMMSQDRQLNVTLIPLPCCIGIRGNIDGDIGQTIDISDLVYLVDYMFSGGPEPPCADEADIDGVGGTDISDLVYLVDYMFTGGPTPVACP